MKRTVRVCRHRRPCTLDADAVCSFRLHLHFLLMLHEVVLANLPEHLGGLLRARPVAFRRRRACERKLSQTLNDAQRRGRALKLRVKNVVNFPLHELPERPSDRHALVARPLELDRPPPRENLYEQNPERVHIALRVQLVRVEILRIQVTCKQTTQDHNLHTKNLSEKNARV